ncbi:chromosome segregation protein SMC [Sphingorhabdus arenilitoris]|uniref:Chromosome partition protein Smc n=1 Tax=Sphingorhabdus arenilitoris TaxID=1490041 RepID=A0ABV8REL4_9SPHN
MRIKSLKLAGFKSFVEPADLKIESGLTGIVGPNGCGKSNLLEAIRWVMGENSAKSMRGGGMEDVIFAGTASRPPRDFAEVTIRAERDVGEPAAGFASNDDDPELEVTRRIERGAGSAYRANGRDVRAKDVALIFADAATGAHSPALVSQGRIGAIIAAKPQERRQMLEEAAGISGLHVRRKDAEQKLRAAENNLERLSNILADMDARAGQLRRQAKQAERYRKLTQDIAQAEGRLIFVRWREAKLAADAARAEAEAAAEKVTAAAAVQNALSEKQHAAVQRLANDRAAAMATRDSASDIAGKLIQLSGERDRIMQRQADLTAQAARISGDAAQEDKLTHDAAEALQSLQAETAKLAKEIKQVEEGRPALIRAADTAERQARESEVALANAMAEQAKAEAELRVADAAVTAAQNRHERANKDLTRVNEELAAIGSEAELTRIRDDAIAAVARLQAELEAANADIAKAEDARTGLYAQREQAESALSSAKAELAALTSEQSALERAVRGHGGDKAIDQIKVQPGYERALAAALGDDLSAAIGGAQGRRWTASVTSNAADGPNLLDHVDAPAELQLRLSMIQVVERDDGQWLNPGQRLVTKDGKLRRWDGFIAEDDGAAAAEQLIRSNRLDQLSKAIPHCLQTVEAQQNETRAAASAIDAAQSDLRARQLARQETENALRQGLRDADKAEDALVRMREAEAALSARLTSATEESIAAQQEVTAARAARAGLPDAAQHSQLVNKLQQEGNAVRQMLMRAQADLSALDQQLAQMKQRRAVAQAEIRSWQDRAGEAERRISEMHKRKADIAEELTAMEGRPDRLSAEIARAEETKSSIAEKLAALQTAEQASEAALKSLEGELADASETLSSAREARAGAQARAENQELRRVEMGRVSGERFECPPPVLPQKLGFDEADLEETAAESARLERLQADRERIGPVNLIASDELAGLEEEQAKGLAESEELSEAINRLRGSIGSLNREGRQRLLAAFEAVDQHFRRLFTTLFNGGQAHLELIDSDDPLQAGLEIMAQPPGKKLASLTLLSGGEQALTAVALIFGLFLTNPAPICVLDEVDAPLDDANIERFCDLLDVMQRETNTRYLIVTHNAVTMSRMHRLFGVTMVEQGVSRLVSVDLGGAEELLAAE